MQSAMNTLIQKYLRCFAYFNTFDFKKINLTDFDSSNVFILKLIQVSL